MNFCKYSKYMSDVPNSKKSAENQLNSKFSEKGLYVREDDQDWGSAGMNDVQQEFDINK